MGMLDGLTASYRRIKSNPNFRRELNYYLVNYAGRPTPLYFARNLTRYLGRAKVYLKREDLLHTGAHKINNTLGQIILARHIGKTRIIAETGAGQHGVATATVAALFGLKCCIYMGEEDIRRQGLNVLRMKVLGAEVVPVSSGSKTLKDAMNEAIRDWVTNVRDTYYLIGSTAGPHPYPLIVRDLQSVIGKEARRQILKAGGRLPQYLVACVGGGSNSMGLFYPFVRDKAKFIGVEAAGHGLASGQHAATLSRGAKGVLHGSLSYVLQDKHGQINIAHSVSAGLDYPGVGPEHSLFKQQGRAEYFAVTDKEAMSAFGLLSRLEGIIPALESAHAVAYLVKAKKRFEKGEVIILCLSGRGDKDMDTAATFWRKTSDS